MGPLSPPRAGARGPGCSSSGPAWCVYVRRGAPTARHPHRAAAAAASGGCASRFFCLPGAGSAAAAAQRAAEALKPCEVN